jgi:hydrogenase maturation protein HypF
VHTRKRLRFRGIVQGVGFRPAGYRCAVGLGLSGFVQNRRSEVVAEIQGPADRVDGFLAALSGRLPAAARIDAVALEPLAPVAEGGFAIRASEGSDWLFPPIPPDLALCPDCRR